MRFTWHDKTHATGYDPVTHEHVRAKKLATGEWEISAMQVAGMKVVASHRDTCKAGIMAWKRQRYRR